MSEDPGSSRIFSPLSFQRRPASRASLRASRFPVPS